jgi:ribonuclease PH
MNRLDARPIDKLRQVSVTRDFVKCAEGSCLIEVGRTRVLCNASISGDFQGGLKILAKAGLQPNTLCSQDLQTLA